MNIPLNYSLRNLWVRWHTTIATVIGFMLVVFVFVAVMMLANGLKKTLVATGSDRNAIMIRKSATSELVSGIEREQGNIVKALNGIAVNAQGKPLVATEVVVVIALKKKDGGTEKLNVTARGVSPESLEMRDMVKLTQGRMWTTGSSEVVVGRAVAKRFANAGIGSSLRFGQREWTVVGIFDAAGTGFESEIWGDIDQLMPAFDRPVYSSITARLADPNGFEAFKTQIAQDPRLTIDTKPEKQFYAEQSQMLALFIKLMGIIITIIFSLGAMIGATITMYASVAHRIREIGTLRALGFPRRSILTAFLLEAVGLSIVGATLGILLAALLSTTTISTTNFNTFAELEFGFTLSPEIVAAALIFSISMGIMGGFFPAVRASRLPIVDALRT